MSNKHAMDTKVALFVLVITVGYIMTMFMLVRPSITGLYIYSGVDIDQEYNESTSLLLVMDEVTEFGLEGYISRGFLGKVFLNDKLIVDYSDYSLDSSVDGSTIDLELVKEDINPDVVGLMVESGENSSYLCTKWQVEDIFDGSVNTFCNGNIDCCSFIGVEQETGIWYDGVYINKEKYDSGVRNIVKVQLFYANYSLNISDSYSDIRYSDIKNNIFSKT
jgi:hypothetical protein